MASLPGLGAAAAQQRGRNGQAGSVSVAQSHDQESLSSNDAGHRVDGPAPSGPPQTAAGSAPAAPCRQIN